MRTITNLTSAIALIAASSALAQDDVEDASAADTATETSEAAASDIDEKAEDPGKRMRCKQVRVLNSRIPTRVCLTVEEWEERNRETLEEKRRMRNRNSYCSGSGPC